MQFFLSSLYLVGGVTLASIASRGAELTPLPVQKLDPLVVSEPASVAEKFPHRQLTETVTATRMTETINALDPGDAVKYLPSVFLRKRNYGDTQSVMATRVWGVSSSARSLVYADGILLSALIANNNTIGAPRWGMVSPAEIERVDLMYGPFAAAYAGNSMGAVLEITTRQPEKFEGAVTQTAAWQTFDQYATRQTFRTLQSAANVGNRHGKFSFWVSANYQDSYSQPLSYVTSPTFPPGTTGGFAANNKLGQPANVAGASGLLHTRMTSAKIKVAYDFTSTLRAAYTFGLWQNDGDATVETYLRNATGAPTFAGLNGFASGYYRLLQQHSAHSVSLKSKSRGAWDFGVSASLYRMDKDWQRLPSSAGANSATFGPAGRVAVMSGTAWSTFDFEGAWRSTPKEPAHAVSFGAHDDRYQLSNPTYNTSDWRSGGPYTSIATQGDGKTRTPALWVQDVWRLGSAAS